MVLERFRNGAAPVYERFAARGRMLPPGLAYIDSWVDAENADRCFQLMETDDPATLALWTSEWDDLVAFEIVPVVGSSDAAALAGFGEIPPEPSLR
jgi:hypothetical protein